MGLFILHWSFYLISFNFFSMNQFLFFFYPLLELLLLFQNTWSKSSQFYTIEKLLFKDNYSRTDFVSLCPLFFFNFSIFIQSSYISAIRIVVSLFNFFYAQNYMFLTIFFFLLSLKGKLKYFL